MIAEELPDEVAAADHKGAPTGELIGLALGADRELAAKVKTLESENAKQAKLIEMLKRPEGVTIAEVVEALQWQAHTVRGAIAGALKKKLGLKVESEKVDAERGRVYRITE